MKPIVKELIQLQNEVEDAMVRLDLSTQRKKLQKLEKTMESTDFWQDPNQAEAVSKEAASLKQYLTNWDELLSDIKSTRELIEISSEAETESYKEVVDDIANQAKKLLLAVRFNGDNDNRSAIMQLSAGVGGTDAADWTAILERMYLRYAERNGLNAEVLEESPAEEAGLKSATIRFSGPYAFGSLRSEKGVHRLVRLSPFNSQNLRQTSFTLVDVIPEIPAEEVEIDPGDIKIDTYRSSGHGGQSVNTTDSAVRITHLPTGIVVAIQNERSQLKNKQRAMSVLASRLSDLAREQHLSSIKDLKASKSADWGSQIRNYVLHPYQKVKDTRSGFESSDVQSVLDGQIEPLIEAYLSSQIKG